MPRKNSRNAWGMGSIRQRKDGTWEGRYTIPGRNPGTGKQDQRSVYGKTQGDVRKKLQAIQKSIDDGTYAEPSRVKVSQWLDTWLDEYTGNVKEHTKVTYETQVRVHIKPGLGAVKLRDLKASQVQSFYNKLLKGSADMQPIAPKTIRNVHGILHEALDKAVDLDMIARNPCDKVTLPRVEEAEMHPLTQAEMDALFSVINGGKYELLFKVDIFTGMRQSEILGLTWDRVNFENGTIYIDRQLIHEKKKGGVYKYSPPKNDKARMLTVAPRVIQLLKEQQERQNKTRSEIGDMWNDGGFPGLVFTTPLGGHYAHNTLSHGFKRAVEKIGVDCRFHDMRHTYAVNSLRAGDDVKTVQANLGHATAAFTLQKYAHYTEDMRVDSAARMETFMDGLKNL